ncbi:hypothetical protein COX67_05115, partial [Candidatus Falkowbacteria bacterium CG_4_10_14_0_2_um_filter_36_22]
YNTKFAYNLFKKFYFIKKIISTGYPQSIMINLSFGKYILKKIKNPADIFFVIPAQAGINMM